MILAASDTPASGLWMVLLVLCLVTLSLMLVRIRRGRRPVGPNPSIRRELNAMRGRSELHRSADELLIQLEEMARRINAQVDTKFAKLDRVVMDADERLARLEAALSRADRLAAVGSTSGQSESSDAGAQAAPARAEHPTDTRHAGVYDLADAGKSPVEIAERLGMPLGEVEVILNLRNFR